MESREQASFVLFNAPSVAKNKNHSLKKSKNKQLENNKNAKTIEQQRTVKHAVVQNFRRLFFNLVHHVARATTKK